MSSFGVTDVGFVIKTLQQILDEIETDERAEFGAKINTQADSVLGVINGIFAAKIAELWELAQAVIAARTLDGASGAQLEAVVALAGIKRRPASASYATIRFYLAAGVTATAGSIVSQGDGGPQWTVRTDVVNPRPSDPSVVMGIVDSVDTGVIPANAYSIDTIVSTISGWTHKAAIESVGAQPFGVTGGDTMVFNSSTTSDVISFINGNFATPGAATAVEIANVINAQATGVHAYARADGTLYVEDTNDSPTSNIQYAGGNYGIAFQNDNIVSFNPDLGPSLLSANAGPYNLSGGNNILVLTTWDNVFTITLPTGASTSAIAVASSISSQVSSEAFAMRADGGIYLGNNGFLSPSYSYQITGGTAAGVLAFPETVASGVSGDGVVGSNEETDAELKSRYLDSLFLPGAGTPPAIKAAVEQVTNVEQVIVLQNIEDTEVDGIPAHGIKVIVSGGADQAIGEAIFSKLSAGTPTVGDVAVTVIDANGDPQIIYFSRADIVPIWINITVKIDPDVFGGGDSIVGKASVQQLLKQLGDANQDIGDDVVALRYRSAALSLAGVLDVPVFTIDTTNPPVNTANIPITGTQVATFSTANITVLVTT